ncbi:MAG: hypothetical protein A2504_06265 [Bdellovibrionales bacterium RIFOXYD12_FULL_39_22]|nr:MAG: hypothetical protein A2385_08585 [Bdellovibrionales bacterium RIFOXYB1_FULL_39_21]OFZ45570.1 MAG: hypothetical protein A2404_03165 [Bdellovibrionales bacterium RIFOXYC1_FULL_39_130]OFZ77431.1 MAG: hypothetical protein A2560_08755 [Bdellovibrionales bacterium RIFOXYD1_FULL_39_84]OFZ91560.1 MAG: hypothetical protein A2504_06265 [Bdellovibrionales bacterium RIFOXYD12_FULL_39_22]HLE11982.1 hypothetical protein [Bacteriovoracaceae bacterium]
MKKSSLVFTFLGVALMVFLSTISYSSLAVASSSIDSPEAVEHRIKELAEQSLYLRLRYMDLIEEYSSGRLGRAQQAMNYKLQEIHTALIGDVDLELRRLRESK